MSQSPGDDDLNPYEVNPYESSQYQSNQYQSSQYGNSDDQSSQYRDSQYQSSDRSPSAPFLQRMDTLVNRPGVISQVPARQLLERSQALAPTLPLSALAGRGGSSSYSSPTGGWSSRPAPDDLPVVFPYQTTGGDDYPPSQVSTGTAPANSPYIAQGMYHDSDGQPVSPSQPPARSHYNSPVVSATAPQPAGPEGYQVDSYPVQVYRDESDLGDGGGPEPRGQAAAAANLIAQQRMQNDPQAQAFGGNGNAAAGEAASSYDSVDSYADGEGGGDPRISPAAVHPQLNAYASRAGQGGGNGYRGARWDGQGQNRVPPPIPVLRDYIPGPLGLGARKPEVDPDPAKVTLPLVIPKSWNAPGGGRRPGIPAAHWQSGASHVELGDGFSYDLATLLDDPGEPEASGEEAGPAQAPAELAEQAAEAPAEGSAEEPAAPPAPERPGVSATDLDRMAVTVERRIIRRLALEGQRRGVR